MTELNRWNERIQMPDGHPLPFKAMLDAARICFPLCNEASRALRTGGPFDAEVVKALRSLAYAIEQSTDFQIAEYFEDGAMYKRVQLLEERYEALAEQIVQLNERYELLATIGDAKPYS